MYNFEHNSGPVSRENCVSIAAGRAAWGLYRYMYYYRIRLVTGYNCLAPTGTSVDTLLPLQVSSDAPRAATTLVLQTKHQLQPRTIGANLRSWPYFVFTIYPARILRVPPSPLLYALVVSLVFLLLCITAQG